MLLHWGKDFLMRTLPEDLQLRFEETLVDPKLNGAENVPIPHINGQTGEVMARIAMPVLVRVSRKKLRNWLTSKRDLNISVSPSTINLCDCVLRETNIYQFNKKLVSVASNGSEVIATFEDGSTERGHFIVGCDGSRSKVREYLVGLEATMPFDTGMTIINYAFTGYTSEQALLMRKYHPVATCFYDPKVDGIFLLTGMTRPKLP